MLEWKRKRKLDFRSNIKEQLKLLKDFISTDMKFQILRAKTLRANITKCIGKEKTMLGLAQAQVRFLLKKE